MKKVLFKITSIVMALLLLLSTLSWKVEKHYCMGRLMDMAFFIDAEDCGMSMSIASNADTIDESKTSCCSDEVLLVEGQNHLKTALNDLETNDFSFLFAYTQTYLNLVQLPTRQLILVQYPPPILVKDIQLFDQVFLI